MAIRQIETHNYFGELRERLATAGITGGAFAAKLGIDHAQLSRWLSGRLDPKLSSIERIEAALEELEEGNGK